MAAKYSTITKMGGEMEYELYCVKSASGEC